MFGNLKYILLQVADRGRYKMLSFLNRSWEACRLLVIADITLIKVNADALQNVSKCMIWTSNQTC
jgi:hypothetical protein